MKRSGEERGIRKKQGRENDQPPARIDFFNNNGDNLRCEANVSNCDRSSLCRFAYPRNLLLRHADAEQFDCFDITPLLGRQYDF